MLFKNSTSCPTHPIPWTLLHYFHSIHTYSCPPGPLRLKIFSFRSSRQYMRAKSQHLPKTTFGNRLRFSPIYEIEKTLFAKRSVRRPLSTRHPGSTVLTLRWVTSLNFWPCKREKKKKILNFQQQKKMNRTTTILKEWKTEHGWVFIY